MNPLAQLGVTLLIALIAATAPIMVARSSKRRDVVAEKSDSFEKIMEGLNSMIALIRADNTELRTRIDASDERLDKALSSLSKCVSERRRLRIRVDEFEEKYGIEP